MKLNNVDIGNVLSQYEADAIPPDHPLEKRLTAIFGDHSFFLDGGGLKIVEPNEPENGGAGTGRVVELASWVDDERTKLLPHEREPTEIVVTLGAAA